MIPTEILSLLVQVPLIAVFIWFVLEWSKRNQVSMDKRDEQMRAFLKEQREADRELLSRIATKLDSHDDRLKTALTAWGLNSGD